MCMPAGNFRDVSHDLWVYKPRPLPRSISPLLSSLPPPWSGRLESRQGFVVRGTPRKWAEPLGLQILSVSGYSRCWRALPSWSVLRKVGKPLTSFFLSDGRGQDRVPALPTFPCAYFTQSPNHADCAHAGSVQASYVAQSGVRKAVGLLYLELIAGFGLWLSLETLAGHLNDTF
ncbi:hypothetical protein DFP72DRAFT_339657 [Ephemerocybe angulata]|uniref:Uncharacterized protein n=1 Tax=Ephemerocybe angulata TaxID=980116 RepID=A0A8H6HZX7_9AGAR|nr:hypothetical protein DFP72DRAFT_339657 [Tulosesus angulatus]